MSWQYVIEWFPGPPSASSSASKNIVVVTSKPRARRESDLIKIDAWTDVDGDNGNRTEAVAVYASVTRGGLPVLSARITMEVVDTDSMETVYSAVMLDDGYGGETTCFCCRQRLRGWLDVCDFMCDLL
jgi:hypothetical protein